MTVGRSGRQVWMALLAALAVCGGALAESVTLRSSVRIEEGAAIVLRDVAELEGAYAESLGGLVVCEDPARRADGAGWTQIPLSDVRRALVAGGAKVNRLAISGATCTVRFASSAVAVEAPKAVEEPETQWVLVSELAGAGAGSGGGSVRESIGALIARTAGVDADNTRLIFDADDAERLDRRLTDRMSVELGSSVLSSVVARVSWFDEEGELAEVWRTTVQVEIRRTVLRVREGVSRRGELPPGSVEAVTMWLSPGGPEPISASAVLVGATAKYKLEPGWVLREGHLELPPMVLRNSMVKLECRSGGMIVRVEAKALDDGKLGERVRCRVEGSRRVFLATVEGPSAVSVVIGEQTEESR